MPSTVLTLIFPFYRRGEGLALGLMEVNKVKMGVAVRVTYLLHCLLKLSSQKG